MIDFVKEKEKVIKIKIEYLERKGFIITDEEKAKKYIERVGLHRLSRYFNIIDNYNGFDFQRIIDSYIFDKEFRGLNFQLIEIIEKQLKNFLIFFVPDYLDEKNYLNIGLNFNLKKEIKKIRDRLTYNEKKVIDLKYNDLETKEYYEKNQKISPELFYDKLSFGEVINIFKDLNIFYKSLISKNFGINYKVFEQWLLCLLDLRNLCSHSQNIFNKKFLRKIRSKKILEKIGGKNMDSYMAYFLILLKINLSICSEYNWFLKICSLMKKYNIGFKDFLIEKENSHLELESFDSEAWELLVIEL